VAVALNESRSICIAIRDVVERAARSERLLYLEDEAHRLIEQYPDTQVTAAEIREKLTRVAVAMGISVALG
jgi:hypothetical protein